MFVLQKQKNIKSEPFVYALADLQNHEEITRFRESFQKWRKVSEN